MFVIEKPMFLIVLSDVECLKVILVVTLANCNECDFSGIVVSDPVATERQSNRASLPRRRGRDRMYDHQYQQTGVDPSIRNRDRGNISVEWSVSVRLTTTFAAGQGILGFGSVHCDLFLL
jgi:hypothetical protein